MELTEVVETSRRVAAAGGRLEKIGRLSALLRCLRPEEVRIGVAYLSGETPQGRIGIGPATIREARPGSSAEQPLLSLVEVDRVLEEIASVRGPGSAARRVRLLRDLFARATNEEQQFLARLLMGELRQGAQEGVMVESVARAAGVPASLVRRALMFSGDLAHVAQAARLEGERGLARFSIELFRPVQPMLAQTAENVDEALERLGLAVLEYKLDGARVQVHRAGDEVRVYTRRSNEVTDAVPEIVQAVRAMPVNEVVLDGEALAFRADGEPQPFQVTMRRFGRRLDVSEMMKKLPLSVYFFDCLYLDGEPLVDRPTAERAAAMGEAMAGALIVPRRLTRDPVEARAFLSEALRAGHEGVMAKSLDAPYEAGRRGRAWLKLKPAHTLDLVVLAAEWGTGRRRGWLSNLHLGARDPATGGFAMLGKTFKGFRDQDLEWQTQRLQELEISRDAHTVYVRPQLVVEIAFDGVEVSPRYQGGLALRFARFKRYRLDKRARDADTIDSVRAVYERGR